MIVNRVSLTTHVPITPMKNVIYHIPLGLLCIHVIAEPTTRQSELEQVGKSAPRHLFVLLGRIHCSIPYYASTGSF